MYHKRISCFLIVQVYYIWKWICYNTDSSRTIIKKKTYCENRSSLVMTFWWPSPSWGDTSLKLPSRTSNLSSRRMLLAWISLQSQEIYSFNWWLILVSRSKSNILHLEKRNTCVCISFISQSSWIETNLDPRLLYTWRNDNSNNNNNNNNIF